MRTNVTQFLLSGSSRYDQGGITCSSATGGHFFFLGMNCSEKPKVEALPKVETIRTSLSSQRKTCLGPLPARMSMLRLPESGCGVPPSLWNPAGASGCWEWTEARCSQGWELRRWM